MVYVPEKGERVRVVEVSPEDPTPAHAAGDVITVYESFPSGLPRGWGVYVTDDGMRGTWCRVEPEHTPRATPAPLGELGVRERLGAVPPFMSTDSATRKLMPVATGVLAYFPDALMCVAWVSRVGNEKHNPGTPLHWAKEKSADEKDAEVRHLLDTFRGLPPDPGLEALGEIGHLASKAWRALADLQRACDAERAMHG